MRLMLDVAAGLWAAFRETLPSTEAEAGPFLGGFTWAFCLHWVILVTVTLAWYGSQR